MKGGVVLHKQSVKLNQAVLTSRTKGTSLLGWHIYSIRMPTYSNINALVQICHLSNWLTQNWSKELQKFNI